MNAPEIRDGLREPQVIATVPPMSEEEITELMRKKLTQRTARTGGIWLIQLGVHTKTGHGLN